MEFLKKHYEKIILGAVLVGLAVAVAFLPFIISNEQQKLKAITDVVTKPRVHPLTNLDLSISEVAIKHAGTPAMIDFGPPNRLFNPMAWQKTADNKIVPSQKLGPSSLTVTNVTPLYLILTFDSITGSSNYVIGVEKQLAATQAQRAKKQTLCTLNPPTKNDTFTIVGIKGNPEDPAQIIVELKDTGEKVSIAKDQPFKRVDGYMADLRYEPEKKSWNGRRVTAQPPQPPINLNGEEYNIVAINQKEVVLSAKINGKKWPIKVASAAP
jgi:hypothetical protein